MKQDKVLVDVNVIISASIFYLFEEMGVKFKHQFYDISKPLFDFFEENREIGIFTEEIENSTTGIPRKAIEDEINSFDKKEIEEKKLFDNLSFILSESERRLEKNKKILTRIAKIKKKDISKKMSEILMFYNNLKGELEQYNPIKEGKVKSFLAPRSVRRVAKNIYIEQAREYSLYYKLKKILVDKPINANDIQILAHATYLKKFYSKITETRMFVASTDHHFSPIRENKPLNNFIPERIEGEFKVICDWPDNILKELE